jgi:hypothetical protein
MMSFRTENVLHGIAIAVIVMATGCASSPNTYSNKDSNTDFTRYKTFGYFSTLSTDNEQYESLVSNFLKVAVAQEMDKRGLTYAEDPDIKVNFYINTKEKIRTRNVPTTSAYYGYRDPFYDPWMGYGGYETRVDQYTEGTLNIDVVDASTDKLIWEGFVVGRVTDEAVRNLEETIDKAVAVVMADFPIMPGGGLAP